MTDRKRTAFIQRVRSALGEPVRDPAAIRATFADPGPDATAALQRRVLDRTPQERELLMDRLAGVAAPLNIQLSHVPDASSAVRAIAEVVGTRTPEWGGEKRVVAWSHPLIRELDLQWAMADLGVALMVTESGGNREAVRKAAVESFVGVTSAEWCVASTATLAARNHPGMPRSVSLLPSIHVAVIRAEQVVADFHELYAMLNAELDEQGRGLTDAMTFITGPSKTADIEATLVHGAHGPRELHLIVIDE